MFRFFFLKDTGGSGSDALGADVESYSTAFGRSETEAGVNYLTSSSASRILAPLAIHCPAGGAFCS